MSGGFPNTEPLVLSGANIRELLSMSDAIGLLKNWLMETCGLGDACPPRLTQKICNRQFVLTCGHGGMVGEKAVDGLRIYYSGSKRRDRDAQLTATFDAHTGALSGVVLGAELGELRTGALGGIAIDLLAPAKVQSVLIFGAGGQAASQLRGLEAVRNPQKIGIVSRTRASASDFILSMQPKCSAQLYAATDWRSEIGTADLVITATNSEAPLFRYDELPDHVHVNAIGPKLPDHSELPEELYRCATLLTTDSPQQYEASGYHSAKRSTRSSILSLSELLNYESRPVPKEGKSIYLSCGISGSEPVLAQSLIEKYRSVQTVAIR